MSNTFKVNPNIKQCPACGLTLKFNNIESKKLTSCRCGFMEAAGSLHILDHINDVLSEYAAFKNIHSVKGLLNESYSIAKGNAFSAYGFLSLLLKRSQTFIFGDTPVNKVFNGIEIMEVISTDKGILGERVSLKNTGMDSNSQLHALSIQIILLTYVIDETLNASSLNQSSRKSGVLYIEDVVGVAELVNIDTLREKFRLPTNEKDLVKQESGPAL